jgi:type III restriction enzyme
MKQVVIENPVINSPFEEPQRHFKFTDERITNEQAVLKARSSPGWFLTSP